MSENTPCQLLTLSQEIGNLIYDYLTMNIGISPRIEEIDDYKLCSLLLLDTMIPVVLRTNKQLHDEYT